MNHREHLQLTWEVVARRGVVAALSEVPAFLRGFAVARGRPDVYHETLTLGYVLLVADRYAEGEAFEVFLERNPELLGPLDRWWRAETLASERARRRFVFPDGPTPGRTPAGSPDPRPRSPG